MEMSGYTFSVAEIGVKAALRKKKNKSIPPVEKREKFTPTLEKVKGQLEIDIEKCCDVDEENSTPLGTGGNASVYPCDRNLVVKVSKKYPVKEEIEMNNQFGNDTDYRFNAQAFSCPDDPNKFVTFLWGDRDLGKNDKVTNIYDFLNKYHNNDEAMAALAEATFKLAEAFAKEAGKYNLDLTPTHVFLILRNGKETVLDFKAIDFDKKFIYDSPGPPGQATELQIKDYMTYILLLWAIFIRRKGFWDKANNFLEKVRMKYGIFKERHGVEETLERFDDFADIDWSPIDMLEYYFGLDFELILKNFFPLQGRSLIQCSPYGYSFI